MRSNFVKYLMCSITESSISSQFRITHCSWSRTFSRSGGPPFWSSSSSGRPHRRGHCCGLVSLEPLCYASTRAIINFDKRAYPWVWPCDITGVLFVYRCSSSYCKIATSSDDCTVSFFPDNLHVGLSHVVTGIHFCQKPCVLEAVF